MNILSDFMTDQKAGGAVQQAAYSSDEAPRKERTQFRRNTVRLFSAIQMTHHNILIYYNTRRSSETHDSSQY